MKWFTRRQRPKNLPPIDPTTTMSWRNTFLTYNLSDIPRYPWYVRCWHRMQDVWWWLTQQPGRWDIRRWLK